MLFLEIVGGIFTYSIIAGAVWTKVVHYVDAHKIKTDGERAFFSSVFWPIALPLFLGWYFANFDQRRHTKKVIASERAEELARIARNEAKYRADEAEQIEREYHTAIGGGQPVCNREHKEYFYDPGQ